MNEAVSIAIKGLFHISLSSFLLDSHFEDSCPLEIRQTSNASRNLLCIAAAACQQIRLGTHSQQCFPVSELSLSLTTFDNGQTGKQGCRRLYIGSSKIICFLLT